MTAEQIQFSITRTFDAPRIAVWQAWTEPERLAQWWGPKGCTIQVVKLELRPDGVFHYGMNFNGGTMWGKFRYCEIVAPEKLVYISSFADEKGNTTRAPFSPVFPLELHNTLTFSEHEGKTLLNLDGGPINASLEEQQFFESMHGSMQQGFNGTFDQLAHHLTQA